MFPKPYFGTRYFHAPYWQKPNGGAWSTNSFPFGAASGATESDKGFGTGAGWAQTNDGFGTGSGWSQSNKPFG